MRLVDITGGRFGCLTVVKRADNRGRQVAWSCHCDCGAQVTVRGDHLRAGASTSCGCTRAPAARLRVTKYDMPDTTKHGHNRGGTRTSTHAIWTNMVQRCTNPRNPAWDDYGGRGITVCDRWRHDFAAFLADMGERPEGLTLDRIDNDRGYSPDNCRWTTWTVQRRNQRARKVPA